MSTEQPLSRGLSEYFQFIIALIMVLALVVFLAILYDKDKFDEAQTVVATFGAFVGVIIGFYFGQKPVQQLARQASRAEEEKEKSENKYDSASNDYKLMMENLRKETKEKLNKQIDELDKLLGGNE